MMKETLVGANTVIANISGTSPDTYRQAIQDIMASIPEKSHAGRVIEAVGELYANQFDHKDYTPAQIEVSLDHRTGEVTVKASGQNHPDKIRALGQKLQSLEFGNPITRLGKGLQTRFEANRKGGRGLYYMMRNSMASETDENILHLRCQLEDDHYSIEVGLPV